MKKLLLTAAAVLAALNIWAQGSGSVTLSTATIPQTDTGKFLYNEDGTKVTSTQGYNVALYWAPAGTTDERAFTRIGNAGGISAGTPGTFNLFGRTITYPQSVATGNGAVLAFQIRGWTTANGNDYDIVVASGQGKVGKNPIWEMKTKDDTNSGELRPNVWEIRAGTSNPAFFGFSTSPVPEPSVIGLGLLGAGALLMLRRRK